MPIGNPIKKIASNLSLAYEIGIEIGSSVIKFVRYNQELTAIDEQRIIKFPSDVLLNGEVISEEGFFKILKPVLSELKLKNKNMALILPDNLFVISTLEIFKTETEEEKEALIQAELEEKIYNYDSQAYDTKYISLSDLGKHEEILAMSLSKETRAYYIKLFEKLKLYPVMITPTIYPLYRLLIKQKARLGLPLYRSAAMINLGNSSIKVLVEANGVFKYYRTIGIGFEEIPKAIKEYFSVEENIANKIKDELDLMVELKESNRYFSVLQDFKILIRDSFDQIERVLALYERKNPQNEIESMILGGSGSLQKGLLEYMTDLMRKKENNHINVKEMILQGDFKTPPLELKELVRYDTLIGLLKN